MDGLKVNLLEIKRIVQGLNFPSSKEDLIKQTKESGADEDIISALEKIPDKIYNTPDEISEALEENK